MSASTSARTLLSRSFAAARQAMTSRPPTLPRPPVRVTAARTCVRSARSSPIATSTRWFSSSPSSSASSSSSTPPPSPPSSASASSSDSGSAPSTPTFDSHALGAPETESNIGATGKQPIGKIEPRLSLTFTCQAGPEKNNPVCGHRSSHEFKKHSYEKGVVIIQCPECKARHLIADHLGWFNDVTEGGQHKTVEDLVKAKGEKVTKGRVNFDGDIEYAPE